MTPNNRDVAKGRKERLRVGGWWRRGGVDRLDPVDRIDRQRVGLGAVVAGAAADEVAVAVAGEQPVVAFLAVEEVAVPAAGQRVVAGPAEKAVSLSAPVSESLPEPPSAVTSRPGRPGETVSWSSPPPPLTASASAAKSTVNGTRFVRRRAHGGVRSGR